MKHPCPAAAAMIALIVAFVPTLRADDPPRLLEQEVELTTVKEQTTLVRTSGKLLSTVDLKLRNKGSFPLESPLHAAVEFTDLNGGNLNGLTMAGMLGGIGQAPYQTFYRDLSPGIAAGLAPGAETTFTISFERPSATLVSYKVHIHGVTNRPPVASPGGPYAGQVGAAIPFNASASNDPDGDALTFAWDFGDGATAAGPEQGHAYQVPGIHTARLTVTDPRGGSSTRDVEVVVSPSGDFALARTRTLDGNGHPLGGVTVSQAGPAGNSSFASDPDTGFLSLGGGAGEHTWSFSRDGYLTTHRKANLVAGSVRVVAFPWLAALNSQRTELSVLNPTTVASPSGAISLVFPAGAFDQIASVAVTDLHGQNLPLPLPHGWSPLAAFHLEMPGESAENLNATVRLLQSVNAGSTLVLVRCDPATMTWTTEAVIAGNGSETLTTALTEPGSHAVVIADTLPSGNPAATVVGQPLPAGSAPSVAANVTAVGVVNPTTNLASLDPEKVTAQATVDFTNGDQSLPSGAWFLGDVTETYDLRDGQALKTPDYDATFYAYQHPGDSTASTATARFPLRPRILFGPEQLDEAHIKVDVRALNAFSGAVLTPDGGVLALPGIRLQVPSGATSTPVAAEIRPIPTGGLDRFLGGFQGLFAFDLNLPPLPDGMRLDPTFTGTFAADSHFVLARCVASGSVSGLQPVLRLTSDPAGKLAAAEPVSGPRLPGITGSGQYVLVRITEPEALITGLVRNTGGNPLRGALVRVANEPWLSLTSAAGTFATLAKPGDRTVTGTNPADGNSGEVTASLADAASHDDVEIQTAPTGPRIIATTPADGATKVSSSTPIIIRFSEPLNPGTMLPGTVTVTNPLNVLIEGTLSLNLAATEATFLPNHPLEHAATYTVEVAATVADRQGMVIEGPRTFQFAAVPFFERPVGAQLVIYEPGADKVPAALLAQLPGYSPAPGSSHVVAHGSPGTADPEVPVILVNENTGETATVLSKPDGSFVNFINAAKEDFVSAVFVGANGSRIEVPATRQLFDDGRVGLYHQGGMLEAESDGGAIQVQIEPGEISERTVFRIKSLSVADILQATGGIAPANGPVALPGLSFEVTEGDPPKDGTEVSMPFDPAAAGVPDGVDPEALPFALTRPMKVDGTVVYVTVDKMRYENGRLFTNTCPFGGIDTVISPESISEFGVQFLGPGAAMVGSIGVTLAPMMIAMNQQGITVGGTAAQLPLRTLSNLEAVKLATTHINLVASLLPFSPLDMVDLGQLVENGIIAKARPVGGAIIAIQPAGFRAGGRVHPGLVCAVSDKNGCYNLMAPVPFEGQLTATHPALGKSIGIPVPGLLDVGTKAFVARNVFFMVSQDYGGAIRGVFSSHTPPYPELDTDATLKLDVFTAGPLQMTIEKGVPVVGTTVLGQAATVDDLTFGTPTGPTEVEPGHYEWTITVKAKKGLHALIPIKITPSSTGDETAQPVELHHAVLFGGEPQAPADGFKSADALDAEGPQIVGTLPREGESWPLGQALQIRFNEPVKKGVLSLPGAVTTGSSTAPALELSPDQQTLLVRLLESPGSSGTEVTVTLSQEIADLAGNTLGSSVAFKYPVAVPEVSSIGEHLDNASGAAMLGNYAYVPERAGEGSIKIFNISDPASPKLEATVPFFGGYPRGVLVIPDWGHVPGMIEGASVVNKTEKPAKFGNLLAVVGGRAGLSSVDELGNIVQSGQTLRIYDLSDPLAPVQLAAVKLTARPSTVTKMKWQPPNLYFLENSADSHTVGQIDLQELLIGFSVPLQVASQMFFTGQEGTDIDSNGDYVGEGELRPWPQLDRVREFFGLREVYAAPEFPSQRIEDFDVAGSAVCVVRSMSGVAATETAAKPEFRMLSAGSGQLVPPAAGRYKFEGSSGGDNQGGAGSSSIVARPVRVLLVPGVSFPFAGGGEELLDLALVSLAPGTGGLPALAVLNVTGALNPVLIREIPFPSTIGSSTAGSTGAPGIGELRSAYQREDGLIALVTTNGMILIDPRRLRDPDPPAPSTSGPGQAPSAASTVTTLHPSVVGIFKGGGSSSFYNGENDSGARVVANGGDGSVVVPAPRISFVQFPTAAALVDPSLVSSQSPSGIVDLVKSGRTSVHVRPARFKSIAGVPSGVSSNSPLSFYHVLVQGLGGAEKTIPVILEAVNEAGRPLPNPGPDYPPVRAANSTSLTSAKLDAVLSYDASIPALKAHRMSDDPASEYYNYYLSEPFAVIREKVKAAELNPPPEGGGPPPAPKVILWSDSGLRATLDPDTKGPLSAFAAEAGTGEFKVKVAGVATTLPGGFIPGANPPPLGGELSFPGTFGTINAGNGEFRHQTVDIELPSPRMPIVFQRSAVNQGLVTSGFGRGWDFFHNQRAIYLTPELVPGSDPVTDKGDPEKDIIGESHDILLSDGEGNKILFKHKGTEVPAELSTDPLVTQLGWPSDKGRFYLPDPAQKGVFDLMYRYPSGEMTRLTPDGTLFFYQKDGRLSKIVDRYPKNRHVLRYNTNGELTAIVDQSVTGERWLKFGYFRRVPEGVTVALPDRTVPSGSPAAADKICSIIDSAGRVIDFEYDAKGMLVKRLGVAVTGDNEGFSGRPATTYQIDSTRYRYVGVVAGSGSQGAATGGGAPPPAGGAAAGTALVSATVKDNTAGEPEATETSGAGGAVTLTLPADRAAANMDTGTAKADHADGSTTEVSHDENGYPAKIEIKQKAPAGGAPPPAGAAGAAAYETIHNELGLVKTVIYPEGNSVTYEYEGEAAAEGPPGGGSAPGGGGAPGGGTTVPFRAKGNVKKITKTPGSRGGDTFTASFAYDHTYNLASGVQTDFNGKTITITLQADKRDTEKIDYTDAADHSFTRNDLGQVTKETGPDGVVKEFAYIADSGFLDNIKAGGLLTDYIYDSSIAAKLGQPTGIKPPAGDQTDFVYNARLQATSVKRGSQEEKFGYDENGNVVFHSRKLEAGGSLFTERRKYSQINFLEKTTVSDVDKDGGTDDLITEFTPDPVFRVKEVKLPGGEVRKFTYDHLGHLKKMELGSYFEDYEYDLHGNQTLLKKGGTKVRTVDYDGHDRPVEIINVVKGEDEKETTTLSYFGKGEVKSRKVEGTNGGVVSEMTVAKVDELGRPLSVTVIGSGDATTTYSYTQDDGRKTVITGPQQTTESTRDTAGRPTGEKDSIRNVTITTDGNGNVTGLSSEEDGKTYTVSMEFNSLDQLKKRSDPVGTLLEATSLRLDGLPLQIKDGRGNTTGSSYSKLGEILSKTRPGGIGFKYQYDKNRQPLFVGDKDDGGNTSSYDNTLRLKDTTWPDDSKTSFTAPNFLNLPTTITIPGGSVTAEYDTQGRPTKLDTTYDGGNYKLTDAKYDAMGRMISAKYGSAGDFTYAATYDKLGPLLTTTHTEPGGTYTVSAAIRNDGARTKLTYPSGTAVNEGRHNSGRLTSVRLAGGGTIWEATDFAGAGQPAIITRGGGVTETCTYDGRRRLVSRSFKPSGGGNTVIEDLRFQYDLADNVIVSQRVTGGGRADFYEYDAANRLTRAEYGVRPVMDGASRNNPSGLRGGAGLEAGIFARGFSYDAGGKDLLLGGSLKNPDALALQTAASSPLGIPVFATTITDEDAFLHRKTVDGFDRGDPDPLGNVAKSLVLLRPDSGTPALAEAEFTYNGRSNLVSVSLPDSVSVSCQYRPDGLMHHHKVTGGTSPSETALVWHEGRLLEEYAVSGSGGTLRARYYHANGDAPVAADLRQDDGSMLRVHYVHDQVMSVVAVLDDAGQVLERVRYDAWGQPIILTRDQAPPRVAQIREANGELLVVTSEPVLPKLNASSPGVITTSGQDLDDIFTLENDGGDVVEATVTFAENEPGLPFGSVFRIRPSAGQLPAQITLGIAPDLLVDSWGNAMPATRMNFARPGGSVIPGQAAIGSTSFVANRSAIGNRILWQGQWFDYDTGLVYMRARHYDPFTGQFLQRDPMQYEDSVNLYAGMANNAVSLRDPTGKNTRRISLPPGPHHPDFDHFRRTSSSLDKIATRVTSDPGSIGYTIRRGTSAQLGRGSGHDPRKRKLLLADDEIPTAPRLRDGHEVGHAYDWEYGITLGARERKAVWVNTGNVPDRNGQQFIEHEGFADLVGLAHHLHGGNTSIATGRRDVDRLIPDLMTSGYVGLLGRSAERRIPKTEFGAKYGAGYLQDPNFQRTLAETADRLRDHLDVLSGLDAINRLF